MLDKFKKFFKDPLALFFLGSFLACLLVALPYYEINTISDCYKLAVKLFTLFSSMLTSFSKVHIALIGALFFAGSAIGRLIDIIKKK